MTKKNRISTRFLLIISIVLLTTVWSIAEIPGLIPKTSFFMGSTKGNAKISPNGKYISYLAPSETNVINIWIKSIDKNDNRIISSEQKRNIKDYQWTYDNNHIIYLQDSDGDENFHVFIVEINSGISKDLTPFKGIKAQNILLNKSHPNEILVGLNKRDKRFFDMHRINILTGKMKQETENPGDVRWWLADSDLVIRAAVAYSLKDISTIIRVRDTQDSSWRDLISWPFGETGLLEGYGSETAIAFTPDGNTLFVQAAFEGNFTQLAKIDVRSGKILKIIAKHQNASIWNIQDVTLYENAQVLFNPKTGEVQAVGFNYLIPEWKVIDPDLSADFKILKKIDKGVFTIKSRDLSDLLWTVKYYSDVHSNSYFLYNRKNKKATLLFESEPELKKFSLASMKPLIIKARDGLNIPCYLTLPAGIEAKNLPMVLFMHGGPWARDEWGYNGVCQFFANRGYAVLQINFRSSTGFGKKHINAGDRQWGVGYMQHDITDATLHCIKVGIADPKRIAIIGESYGGYAVLSGLAFTPDLFRCGVSLFGPSNMKTNIQAMPDWWYIIKQRFLRRTGNVLEDEELNRRISPFFHADKIKAKLLIFHGAKDPRVNIRESNRIVDVMRKNHQEVEYYVYPDEGHGIGRSENLLNTLSRTEEFLAKYLGGQAEPWKPIPGCTAESR